jgi:hypothetical protein
VTVGSAGAHSSIVARVPRQQAARSMSRAWVRRSVPALPCPATFLNQDAASADRRSRGETSRRSRGMHRGGGETASFSATPGCRCPADLGKAAPSATLRAAAALDPRLHESAPSAHLVLVPLPTRPSRPVPLRPSRTAAVMAPPGTSLQSPSARSRGMNTAGPSGSRGAKRPPSSRLPLPGRHIPARVERVVVELGRLSTPQRAERDQIVVLTLVISLRGGRSRRGSRCGPWASWPAQKTGACPLQLHQVVDAMFRFVPTGLQLRVERRWLKGS